MRKFIECYEKMKEVYQNGGELYIRCAGKTGRNLCHEMQQLGYAITAYLDKEYPIENEGDGIPIFSPDVIFSKNKGTFYVLIAVKSDELYDEICTDMKIHGLRQGLDFGDFSMCFDLRMMGFMDIQATVDMSTKYHQIAEQRKRELHSLIPNFEVVIPNVHNLIPNLDVPLTTYCNLKCEFCSHCIPYVKNPKHYMVEDIIGDLKKILSVAYVACIAIMGGEAFVYPELVEFVKQYARMDKKNVGFTRVVTNGTLVPKEEFFEEYRKIENGYIYISNYGERSKKIKELEERCKFYHIPVYICPYNDEWLLLGDFSYERNYSEDQLKHLYAVCDSNSCIQLLNGRIYSCGRVPVLNEENLIPFCEMDYCEVRNSDADDIFAERLNKYLYHTPYLQGCKYCDGQHLYSRRVQRGGQI